jgi:hypothetical protein
MAETGVRHGTAWRALAHWDGARVEIENEFVADDWLHIEQMDDNVWWLESATLGSCNAARRRDGPPTWNAVSMPYRTALRMLEIGTSRSSDMSSEIIEASNGSRLAG